MPYLIIEGVIVSISVMLGVAIGAKSGNIKSGLALGILTGGFISAIIHVFIYIKTEEICETAKYYKSINNGEIYYLFFRQNELIF